MLKHLQELDIDNNIIAAFVSEENVAFADDIVKEVRFRILANCFSLGFTDSDLYESPLSLSKTFSTVPDDTDNEKSYPPSDDEDEDKDKGYSYECPDCNEVTMFSSQNLLPDDSYKNICLTDVCIKKALREYAAELEKED